MSGDLQEIKLACVRLGGSLFGVDIMRIREIILPRQLSPLPTPSAYLAGAISLRGAVILVMNLARRLGIASSGSKEEARLLIVKYAEMVLALAVDQVEEVISVAVDQIKPPPEIDGSGYEAVLGVCLKGESVVMILDIDALRDLHDLPISPRDEAGA